MHLEDLKPLTVTFKVRNDKIIAYRNDWSGIWHIIPGELR